MTVVIGKRITMRAQTILVFAVIMLTVVLSLVNWRTGLFGTVYANSGGMIGIYAQKSALGQRAMVCILAALALIFTADRRHAAFRLSAGLTSIGLCLLALVLSKFTTPLLLLLPSTGLLLLILSPWLNKKFVVIGAGMTIGLVGLGPFILSVLSLDLVNATMKELSKDATLTGRTILWNVALGEIQSHWFGGIGFMAFWRSAEYANTVALLARTISDEVLALHNSIMEIAVGTGILGMATLIGTTLARLFKLWWSGYRHAAFAIAFVFGSTLLGLFGPRLFRQHEFSILLFVAIGVAADTALASRHTAKAFRR